MRDQRAKEAKSVSLEKSGLKKADEEFALEDALPFPELQHDERIAFSLLWESLDPDLQRVWAVLVEARGNQVEVARRLGIHRNTVRVRIRAIQLILKRHQF